MDAVERMRESRSATYAMGWLPIRVGIGKIIDENQSGERMRAPVSLHSRLSTHTLELGIAGCDSISMWKDGTCLGSCVRKY